MQPNNRPHAAQTPHPAPSKRENPPEHVILSAVTTPRARARPSLPTVVLDALMRSPLAKRVSPLLRAALQRISDLALRAQAKLQDVVPPA